MSACNTQRYAAVLAMIIALAFATGAREAGAKSMTCTASNTTVAFGNYNVLSGNVRNSTGTFTVTCVATTGTAAATVTWTAKLPSPATLRQLAPSSGSDRLNYALYVNSARTKEWGDGTGGTFTISGSISVPKAGSATSSTQTYYGRITPGGQDVAAASSYTQALTVTVTCTGSPDC